MTSYTSCHIIQWDCVRETPTGAFSAVRMACKESASSRQNGWRGCYEEADVKGERTFSCQQESMSRVLCADVEVDVYVEVGNLG